MPGENRKEAEFDQARHRAVDISYQFPNALDESEREQVVRRVSRILSSVAVLRQFLLPNAVEPASVFRPVGKEQP